MKNIANDNYTPDYYEEMEYRAFAIKILRFQFMVARRKELEAKEAYHG